MLKIENQQHFDEVVAFAERAGLREQLRGKLDYLDTYAEHGERGKSRCLLYKDFAPQSFGFTMQMRDANGDYRTCTLAEIFKNALLANAVVLIACHNHPSGDPAPSTEDDALTARLVDAGLLIDVPVLDHVIVGGKHHFSYAENGQLTELRR